MNLSSFDNFQTKAQTWADGLYQEALVTAKAKREQLNRITKEDVLAASKTTAKTTLVILGVLAYLTYLAILATYNYGLYARALWTHHMVGQKLKRALGEAQEYYSENSLSFRTQQVRDFYASSNRAISLGTKQAVSKVQSELKTITG